MQLRNALGSVRDQSGTLYCPASQVLSFSKINILPEPDASSFYNIYIFALLYNLFLLSQKTKIWLLLSWETRNRLQTSQNIVGFFLSHHQNSIEFCMFARVEKKSIRCIYSLNTPLPLSQAHPGQRPEGTLTSSVEVFILKIEAIAQLHTDLHDSCLCWLFAGVCEALPVSSQRGW